MKVKARYSTTVHYEVLIDIDEGEDPTAIDVDEFADVAYEVDSSGAEDVQIAWATPVPCLVQTHYGTTGPLWRSNPDGPHGWSGFCGMPTTDIRNACVEHIEGWYGEWGHQLTTPFRYEPETMPDLVFAVPGVTP